ncbi:MAG: hypothetical protein ACI8RD_013804 [Bacillariaceae sp.]|jgi:hypothetical protein
MTTTSNNKNKKYLSNYYFWRQRRVTKGSLGTKFFLSVLRRPGDWIAIRGCDFCLIFLTLAECFNQDSIFLRIQSRSHKECKTSTLQHLADTSNKWALLLTV